MKILNLSRSMISFATGNGLLSLQHNEIAEFELTPQFISGVLDPLLHLSPGEIFISLSEQEKIQLKGKQITPPEALIKDEEMEVKLKKSLDEADVDVVENEKKVVEVVEEVKPEPKKEVEVKTEEKTEEKKVEPETPKSPATKDEPKLGKPLQKEPAEPTKPEVKEEPKPAPTPSEPEVKAEEKAEPTKKPEVAPNKADNKKKK